jgi:hypothetical protein
MKKALLLALFLASLLAGCGGGEDGEPAAQTEERVTTTDDAKPAARTPEERVATTEKAPTPAEGTLAPSGPYIGVWRAHLTDDDLADAAGEARLAGDFRLELRKDGSYVTFTELDGELTGRYSAAPGNALVFKDDEGCTMAGLEGTSVYEWNVDGDELTLTLVRPESGGCTGRSAALTLPRWKRA